MNSGQSDSEAKFNTVIVRLGGEIGIKASWTRKLYERRLLSNIKDTFKQEGKVYESLSRKFGRFYVKTPDAEETCRMLTRVFGIASVSPALVTNAELDDIAESSVVIAGSGLSKGSAFAVRCRRVGFHPYSSQDVCRHVGQRLLDAYADRELRVNLSHPDVILEVEVREGQAYIFMETMKGPGGLPSGVQPRIVGLLNGDINSLVACWLVMKRGCPITPLFFAENPQEKAKERRALDYAIALFKWAPRIPRKMYCVSNEADVAYISHVFSGKFRNILSRRLTYRVAEKLAEKCRAEGIVTGDSLRKPVEESLHFFRICDEASLRLPIYRPIIGLESSEIEEMARRIGIDRKLSAKVEDQGKSLISAREISLEIVKEEETRVNMDELVKLSLESLRTISL